MNVVQLVLGIGKGSFQLLAGQTLVVHPHPELLSVAVSTVTKEAPQTQSSLH
jgi:hypothetical protein